MNKQYQIMIYSLVAALVAAALYIGLKPLMNIDERTLIADVAIAGALLTTLLIILNFIFKYSHYNKLPFTQRSTIYVVIGALFSLCWIGGGIAIHSLFSTDDVWEALKPSIPIRIIISILIYSLAVIVYNKMYASTPSIESQMEEVTEDDNSEEETTKELLEIVERIAIKNGSKIDVILVSEIMYLQAEGDYVMIHSTKGKFLKEQTMKSFENILPPEKFVRVHRSSIVNIEFIAQIELFEKQNQLLKLKNGVQVKISLSGYKALKNAIRL